MLSAGGLIDGSGVYTTFPITMDIRMYAYQMFKHSVFTDFHIHQNASCVNRSAVSDELPEAEKYV